MNFHWRIFLSVIFLMGAVSAGAAVHPIDSFEEQCMGEDHTSKGMRDCTLKALQHWEKEARQLYKQLSSLGSPVEQDLTLKSQESWEAFKKIEFKTINSMYGPQQGSMWRSAALTMKKEIVRKRALQLLKHVEHVRNLQSTVKK